MLIGLQDNCKRFFTHGRIYSHSVHAQGNMNCNFPGIHSDIIEQEYLKYYFGAANGILKKYQLIFRLELQQSE